MTITAPRVLRGIVAIGVGLALLLVLAKPARAYPWMIRHGYAACMPCHTDPSGAGPLSDYGRAQGDVLLATQSQIWGRVPEALLPSGRSRHLVVPFHCQVRPLRTHCWFALPATQSQICKRVPLAVLPSMTSRHLPPKTWSAPPV